MESASKAKEPVREERTSRDVDRAVYLREATMALRDGVGELSTALQGLSGMPKMAVGVAKLDMEQVDDLMQSIDHVADLRGKYPVASLNTGDRPPPTQAQPGTQSATQSQVILVPTPQWCCMWCTKTTSYTNCPIPHVARCLRTPPSALLCSNLAHAPHPRWPRWMPWKANLCSKGPVL